MRTCSLVSALVLIVALTACKRPPAQPSQPAAPSAPATPATPAAAGGDWQISADQASWAPVALPSVRWGCDHCDRYFKRTVQGVPKAVSFRFASDNKARLLVNGTEVFAEFWKDKFCTDQPCCAKCCDSEANCKRLVATGARYSLSPEALKAFREGANEVVWQVHQETGGSGFHVEMELGR